MPAARLNRPRPVVRWVLILSMILAGDILGSCGQPGRLGPTVAWPLTAMNVPAAWHLSTGRGETLAVVDTGLGNPALLGLERRVVWPVNLVHRGSPVGDPEGHGTEVLIIAAGSAWPGRPGIAPDSMIMPIEVADATGHTTPALLARGIRWAVAHGADVINLSLAGDAEVPAIDRAVHKAVAAGVLLIAAAGDLGTQDIRQPAALPGVIAVSALDPSGAISAISNRQPGRTLGAPGVNIPTLRVVNGKVIRMVASGTSAACAVVSGLGMLAAAAAWPRRLTTREFVAAFRRSAGDGAFPNARLLLQQVIQWSHAATRG